MSKLLLILLDGVPYANWRRLFGNLEGWVASGEAQVWKMRSVLPSTSGTCYASIHTGLPPQVHGIWGNATRRRLEFPDVFSQATKAGLKTGAVTHSFWSEFFNRYPFDLVEDMEYDEPNGPITHGRFHTMTGDSSYNQMTPADVDLFATLTMLCERKGIDYGILHTCTLDSMGHRFFHDCEEMDDACYRMDEALANFLARWRAAGYEVIVTADHECAGVALIGGSKVSDARLQALVREGGGTALRDAVVGVYEQAGFPKYRIATDGYPDTVDIDNRLLVGYGANADRMEDFRTNERPLQDSQQPFVKKEPLAAYPAGPMARDADGKYMVTGQVPGDSAVHTATDIPLSAFGPGAYSFTGVIDNTDVFFKLAQAATRGVELPVGLRDPGKRK